MGREIWPNPEVVNAIGFTRRGKEMTSSFAGIQVADGISGARPKEDNY